MSFPGDEPSSQWIEWCSWSVLVSGSGSCWGGTRQTCHRFHQGLGRFHPHWIFEDNGPSEKEHEATIAGLRGLCLYKLRTYGDTAGECWADSYSIPRASLRARLLPCRLKTRGGASAESCVHVASWQTVSAPKGPFLSKHFRKRCGILAFFVWPRLFRNKIWRSPHLPLEVGRPSPRRRGSDSASACSTCITQMRSKS